MAGVLENIFLLWGCFLINSSIGFSVDFLLSRAMCSHCIFQGNPAEHVVVERGM